MTAEYTVAAWAGNFDGRPTHKLMGMAAAAPLVRLGLLAAGEGRAMSLPPRPTGLVRRQVCPVSGLPAGPHCPRDKLDWLLAGQGQVPAQRCGWHRLEQGRPVLR